MSDIGKVGVKLSVDPSGLQSGINQAVTSLQKLESTTLKVQKSTALLVAFKGIELGVKGFTAIAGAATSIASRFTQMSKEAAGTIDAMSKVAQRTGRVYSEVSSLAYAAKLSGVGFEQLSVAMSQLERRYASAVAGSKPMRQAFEMVGLAVEDLAGKSSQDRFYIVAEAIAKLPGPAQKTAAAMQLFEEAGMRMVPLFNNGADGIKRMAEESKRLGTGLTNLQAKGVEAMNDSFVRMHEAVNGIVHQVTANLAPLITQIVTDFTNFIAKADARKIGKTITEGIVESATLLADAADWMVAKVGEATKLFQDMNSAESSSSIMNVLKGTSATVQSLYGIATTIVGAGTMIITETASALAGFSAGVAKTLSFGFENTLTKEFDKAAQDAAAIAEGMRKAVWDHGVTNITAGWVDAFGDPKAAQAVDGFFATRVKKFKDGLAGSGTAEVLVGLDKKELAQRQEMFKKQEAAHRQIADAIDRATAPIKAIDFFSAEGRAAFWAAARGDDVAKQQLDELVKIRETMENNFLNDGPVLAMP